MTIKNSPGSLESLVFDNRFIREMPADSETTNYCRQVTGACYSRVQPASLNKPELVACAREVAELLGLDEAACHTDSFTDVFSGNQLLPDMDPYALCYGGHQFGNWAGQLGDGRAINLGEVINQEGQRFTLQLKGAGKTPYSRSADGLAVLRSSVREFLCSEAMYHLGVPTTRALSLILSGEQVMRDMFYDGNAKPEPGAIVCRVAPSFTRFGSFQIFAARGENELLKQLADYTIKTDFPHLLPDAGEPDKAVYLAWFNEICRTTAEMVVHWTRVGFVHGVMNTDNMSILGLTIDYGPYGWLEDFDPDWTPNTTDAQGRRYRFGNQAKVAQWNLFQLANAIYSLVDEAEPLQQALSDYGHTYEQLSQRMMADKLGLNQYQPDTDDELCAELEAILQLVETDMTLFYRQLASIELDKNQPPEDRTAALQAAYYQPEQLTEDYQNRLNSWLDSYQKRVQQDGTADRERRTRMNKVNPKYVLRNYLAQLAIDKSEQGDHSLVSELLEVLRHPYDEQPDKQQFAEKRPEWARSRAGCSMLSCSS
ncbi:protein adenylyltransferase SelO [Amphritea balenae]|uniref:protein adenylyltransferase SelO n=1 Tax=Amphritea balenae TaxID=452629 RepID=UPI001666C7F7|nr:YdiU family protein [Amphritea balenae]GGK71847.1 UPF0061 protein [Amphritea balenae]